MNNIKVLISY